MNLFEKTMVLCLILILLVSNVGISFATEGKEPTCDDLQKAFTDDDGIACDEYDKGAEDTSQESVNIPKNCDEVSTPVYRGNPLYVPHLDRDNDGIGCEDDSQKNTISTKNQSFKNVKTILTRVEYRWNPSNVRSHLKKKESLEALFLL